MPSQDSLNEDVNENKNVDVAVTSPKGSHTNNVVQPEILSQSPSIIPQGSYHLIPLKNYNL